MQHNFGNDFFSIHIDEVDVIQGVPFPIFLYLRINERFIKLRREYDPVGKNKFEKLMEKNVMHLWVPQKFHSRYLRYLIDRKDDGKGASAEAKLLQEVFQDEELSMESKDLLVNALAKSSMQSMINSSELKEAETSKLSEMLDEILMAAGANEKLYLEILSIKKLRHKDDHSVLNASLAVLFAMASGYSEKMVLADLATAALFHDCGLCVVEPYLLNELREDWNKKERNSFYHHIKASIKSLKKSDLKLPERVYSIIADHHENNDGSGFPKAKHGYHIEEMSQFLHLANCFEEFATGKLVGERLSPREAFQRLYASREESENGKEISPEILESVFSSFAESLVLIESDGLLKVS